LAGGWGWCRVLEACSLPLMLPVACRLLLAASGACSFIFLSSEILPVYRSGNYTASCIHSLESF